MDIKIVTSRVVYHGRVFDLCEDQLQYADGHTNPYAYLKHPGACAIVPFLDDETVLLIKQYRHATRETIWEFPAGTLKKDENPEICARRELAEETGYIARNMAYWGKMMSLPSCTDEIIHIFKAWDLTAASQNLDDDEILTVHAVKISDALEMVRTDEITDAKTMNCLLFLHLNKGMPTT